jgi:hypothetical protein
MRKLLTVLFTTLLFSNTFCGPAASKLKDVKPKVYIQTTLPTRLFFIGDVMDAEYSRIKTNFISYNRKRKIKIEDIRIEWPQLELSLIKKNGKTLPNGITVKKSSKPNSFEIPQTVTVPTRSGRALNEVVSNVLACNNHGCTVCNLKPTGVSLQSIAIRTGGKIKGAVFGSGDRIMCDDVHPEYSGDIPAQYKE